MEPGFLFGETAGRGDLQIDGEDLQIEQLNLQIDKLFLQIEYSVCK
ncbi:hypothetical protein LIS77_03755 [Cytobacillus firmus]|nr:hypothetical protein [Cytobacillus firmus]USK39654.1 hypothetical protein LIS77_03755 [Cytobacillus firmus]